MSRIELSAQASADLLVAFAFYEEEASLFDAQRFLFAAVSTINTLATFPGLGAIYEPRPRLRKWRVPQFPYQILYLEMADGVRVFRIVHQARNIREIL